ncbi:MAG TPA: adenine nucleotide alpha hydrolase [Myxococcota bacterium]|nr:adenine nucleotide alpha hydrolase [Myxococcota bacterium]
MSSSERSALAETLRRLGPVAVAVSGGVDSVTLAAFAHEQLGRERVALLHAVSPAVPGDARQRLEHLAAARDWDLRCIDARELEDPLYLANPVNRCFFCKTDLYAAMRRATDRQLLSGTNLDDLGEYRPGLAAARDAGVVHPFVEAGMTKAAVRELARALGLAEVAELPASPCLSSRIETGIPISTTRLRFVEAAETLLRSRFGAGAVVRCRVRSSGVVIELGRGLEGSADLAETISMLARTHGVAPPDVAFAPYANGSAFLRTVA